MSDYRLHNALLTIAVLVLPITAVAQSSYYESNSMIVLSSGNAPARTCYQDAIIAARIHYTSRKNLESCNYALTYTTLTLHDRAATLTNRGIIYMALSDYSEAINDYKKAISLKPELGELNINIGNVYFLGDVFAQAVTEYTTALEKNTSKPHIAHFNRGMAYERLNNYASAETDFKTAMEMMPEWTDPPKKLAEVQQKMNQPGPGGNTPVNP